jgi:Asp-tRNA(Asn)/Glu-tRNA(Gln) amidotransferase A subunit family amidase
VSEGLERLSAVAAATQINAGELTALQLTEAYLARVAERDDVVRAWAFMDPEWARKQARLLDAGPSRGLLHGLSVGIKDIIDSIDQPSGYGSPIYAGHRPEWDGSATALSRAEGAVILGKTVTTEFANRHPGATRIPHDPARTPGGSSSGSAARGTTIRTLDGPPRYTGERHDHSAQRSRRRAVARQAYPCPHRRGR